MEQLAADIAERLRQAEVLRAQPPGATRDGELARLQAELTALQQSYATAVRSYEEVRLFVLLCDIEMPGEDGYQLLHRARSEAGAGRTLVAIAVTAYARSIDRQRALESGFLAHLAKPVDPDELISTIASLAGDRVTAAP